MTQKTEMSVIFQNVTSITETRVMSVTTNTGN